MAVGSAGREHSGGGGAAAAAASAAGSAASGHSATGSTAGGSTTAGQSGGSSGLPYGSSSDAAAGLTPQLAAEGYTVVNGQVVRKLGVGGPNEYKRAATLVAATDAVANPQAGLYIGWALVVLGIILLPPLIAMRRSRGRAAAGGILPLPSDPGADL